LAKAKAHGVKARLVHTWQFPAVGLSHFGGEPLPVFGYADIEKLADAVLTRAAAFASAHARDVAVDTLLVEGHPAEALVEAGNNARLLVVGSRGLGGITGMLLGSVSSSCAHHARCPVAIVPPSVPADAGERRTDAG
jgi:nucleotide-binding universal stress UspA family protein